MAQSCASLFMVSLLLLLAIANPRAGATFFLPQTTGVMVTGQICCTQNGNCPGPAVTGALVQLSCPSLLSGTVVVGQNTTDINGNFVITAATPPGVITGVSSINVCVTSVQVPLNNSVCSALSGTPGVLDGILQTVGTAVIQPIGLVQTLRVITYVVLSS